MANKNTTNINIDITSNKKLYQQALEQAAERILTMIGMDVETAAKKLAPVDTGLLRNSITWAIAGEGANTQTYQANEGGGTGMYQGTAPENRPHQYTVHLGTNVEYAMVQETGSFKHVQGQSPFLRPAVNNNIQHFKDIIVQELKKEIDSI